VRPVTDQDQLICFCGNCRERGATAVTLCDSCQHIACIHMSGSVGGEILCSECLRLMGHDPPGVLGWFRPDED